MESLEPLLVVQAHDLALDRLRHTRATLPERGTLAATEADIAALGREAEALRGPLAELAREQQRLEDEAQSLSDQAASANRKLYSGEINSPKELQALQQDVDQLKRHQSTVEERALEVMEQREPIDTEVDRLRGALNALDGAREAARDALGAAERVVDDDIAAEQSAREASTVGLDEPVLALYERCRTNSPTHVGAAGLIGQTCQGCHLTIPAVEADTLRKAPPGTIAHCDNCGAILVP